jgi:hypothetical protein
MTKFRSKNKQYDKTPLSKFKIGFIFYKKRGTRSFFFLLWSSVLSIPRRLRPKPSTPVAIGDSELLPKRTARRYTKPAKPQRHPLKTAISLAPCLLLSIRTLRLRYLMASAAASTAAALASPAALSASPARRGLVSFAVPALRSGPSTRAVALSGTTCWPHLCSVARC